MRSPSPLAATFGALLLGASILPAHAGVFFEGLEPFTTRHCDPQDPSLTDPKVMAPALSDDKASPGAHSLDGALPFAAPPCEVAGKLSGARKIWTSKTADREPPQK